MKTTDYSRYSKIVLSIYNAMIKWLPEVFEIYESQLAERLWRFSWTKDVGDGHYNLIARRKYTRRLTK